MAHQGYGFCEFLTEEDAEYACKIMNQIKLWGKPIRVNKVCMVPYSAIVCSLITAFFVQASSDKKQLDVGANLFIGNLDENVDERLLYDTFSAFGVMATTAKVRSYVSVEWQIRLILVGIRLQETRTLVSQKDTALYLTQTLNHPMPQLSL